LLLIGRVSANYTSDARSPGRLGC